MRKLEHGSVINDLSMLLDERLPPILKEAQVAGQIIERVNKGRVDMRPWVPRKLCQYPNKPKMDDYNLNVGLGSASLQGAIDSLNNFKVNCLNAVKTKLQAIGPESAKDAKLAKGAATTLKEIYQAAKCFTQIVKNVNNLVDSYISAIDIAVVSVINEISAIENKIRSIIQIVLSSRVELVGLVSVELLNRLGSYGDIFELIGIIASIEAELVNAKREVKRLSQSKNRIMMHLEADLLLLKNRCYAFMYFLKFRDILKSKRSKAQNAYMVDDFLDDLDLNEYPALSYNWSLTNTTEIADCSFYDPSNIIGQLNEFCKKFSDGSVNPKDFVQPILVDARSGSGEIIVPDDGQLLTCGLDKDAGSQSAMILELAINGGSTIISSISYGVENKEEGDEYVGNRMKRGECKYITDSVSELQYSEREILAPGKYRLKVFKDSQLPNVGSLLKFPIPASFNDYFSYHLTGDNFSDVRAIPFKVIESSPNSVVVERYTESETIENEAFTAHYPPNAKITMLDTIDIPSADDDIYVASHFEKIGADLKPVRHYLITDRSTGLPYENSITKTTQTTDISENAVSPLKEIRSLFIASEYNPHEYNRRLLADPSHPAYRYPIMSQKYPILSFMPFDLNPRSGSVHAGDRIPCKDWSLRIYLIGQSEVVNKIRFAREKDDDSTICSFMAKAKWGFIPTVDKDDLPRQTVNVRSPLWKRMLDPKSASSSSIAHSSSSMS